MNIRLPHLLPVLLLLLPLCLARPVTAEPFSPHIERSAYGWIDWDAGLVYGTGRAYLDNNGQAKTKALGAAQLVAAANIVKQAAGLRLDDRRTLERLGGTFTVQLKAFLRYQEHQRQLVLNSSRPYAEVTLVTPLHGIEGLTAQLLTYLRGKPLEWQKFPLPTPSQGRSEQADAPWLVIDARNLSGSQAVQPGLFPKIASRDGRILYDVNRVYQDALQQRGMARYVHSNADLGQLMAQWDDPAWWQQLSPVATAWAAEPRSKRGRYVVARAEQATGLTRTNLVISASDAQRLQTEDAHNELLRQCRVIIVTAAPIGGIEGRRSQPRPLRF